MLIKGFAKKGKLYLTLFIAAALAVAAVYFYVASASSRPYSAVASALTASPAIVNNNITAVKGAQIAKTSAVFAKESREARV